VEVEEEEEEKEERMKKKRGQKVDNAMKSNRLVNE
jgi:hypothetical protein